MTPDKDRIYVALYARGGSAKMPGREDKYHWAIVIGPKSETSGSQGTQYHAKELATTNGTSWVFEEKETPMGGAGMALVRIMVGKVENKARAVEVLRNTPVPGGKAGWNCVSWVEEALRGLERDGKSLGTRAVDWWRVRDRAMEYCQRKKNEHRFDGRGSFDMATGPTFDLVRGKETQA